MNIQKDTLPIIEINEQNKRPNTPENKGITMPKNITYAPTRPRGENNKDDFNGITFRFPSLNDKK